MNDKTVDKKIIFRCDSYEDIGIGHLIRCLSIAKKIQSQEIYFLTEPDSSNQLIKNNGFNILLKEKNESEEESLHRTTSALKPYVTIIDKNYFYKSSFIKKLKENCNKLVFIDNICEGMDSVDENIFPSVDINTSLLKKYLCEDKIKNIKTGLEYILIRDEILDLKNKVKYDFKDQPNITINTGGSDPKGILLKTTNLLKNMNLNSNIFLLVGQYFKFKKDLNELVNCLPDNFHILPYTPENLIKGNLCICKFGLSIYEMIYLQIPSICISYIKEDIFNAEKLQNNYGVTKHAGYIDDLNPNVFYAHLENLLKDKHQYKKMVDNCSNLIDGKGAERIANIIMQQIMR